MAKIKTLKFSEYTAASAKTAVYPHQGTRSLYPLIGLVGEVGEVAEIVKRTIRDGTPSEVTRIQMCSELGDVLWYLDRLAAEWDLDLATVASVNMHKLASRMERGVLKGKGGDR